jgi:hypothetical protein
MSGIANTATAFFGGQLQAGMQVLGSGIQTNCTIASVVNSTTVTLSIAATSSVSNGTFAILSAWLTPANFIGVAVREVSSSQVYGGNTFGLYQQGALADVLQRGSITIQSTTTERVVPWGLVYLRIAAGGVYNYLPVGTWESIADPPFNIYLPNLRFSNASVSPDGVCEISILTRNTA